MSKKKKPAKNLGGRPPKDEADRMKMRYYRSTDAENDVIEAAGQPNVSEWTRKTLLRAARRKK
jgi:hypothetical protein